MRSIVPAQVARMPWRLILTVLAIGGFGLIVLYSAAGGHIKPWAGSQGIKLIVFMIAAVGLSYVRE